jgi:hypothetical protein
MIDVPHVALMTCSKAFLGVFDRVREMSVLFEGPLGEEYDDILEDLI